jgi:hypothetical protein
MRIRDNRRRILSRLRQNNKYRWIVMPIIKASEEKRIVRERIQSIVDKAFPELKGVYVTN